MKRRVKTVHIAKGVRVVGQVQRTYTPSLAGMQMKLGLDVYTVSGVVRHIRSDVETNPGVDNIVLMLDPEEGYNGPLTSVHGCTCGHDHAMLKLRNLIDVPGDPIPAEQANLIIDIPAPQEEVLCKCATSSTTRS